MATVPKPLSAFVVGFGSLSYLFQVAGAPTSLSERGRTYLWAYRFRSMASIFIRKAFAGVLISSALCSCTVSTDPTLVLLLIFCNSCNLLLPIKQYGEVHVEIRGSSQVCTGKFTRGYGEVHILRTGKFTPFSSFPAAKIAKSYREVHLRSSVEPSLCRTGEFTEVRLRLAVPGSSYARTRECFSRTGKFTS